MGTPLTPERRDRIADWGFGVSLFLGAQFATVESLTHLGVHFGGCEVAHAHTFPWMTLTSMMIFAAPKTIGPERVEHIVLGLLSLLSKAKSRRSQAVPVVEDEEPSSAVKEKE